ncbi:MAG TPA: peptide-binding protein [Desulfobulbus sp.]|nr:peptide-binding protein [Desulfobulbus sp.]
MKPTRLLLVLCILGLLLTTAAVAMAEMVAVANDNVNLRSGPGTRYKVTWKLGSGFPLKVLKRKGEWLRVKDFEGTIGWINAKVVNRVPHMIVRVHRKSKKRINVRSAPGTSSRIVAKAYYGVVFRTLARKNGWVKVRHERGVTGWIKRSLLWGF